MLHLANPKHLYPIVIHSLRNPSISPFDRKSKLGRPHISLHSSDFIPYY